MNRTGGRLFWIGQAIGLAIIAFGVRGLIGARLGAPPSFARFFIGGVIAHDLVLAPLAFAVGWLVKRTVPAWTWPAIRNAMFASVAVSLFSYPLIRGFGRRPTNSTVVPRNYAEGLLIVLGVVWAAALGWLVVKRAASRQPDSAASASASRISSP